MSWLARSDSFEYLCYAGIDFKHQNLTSTDDVYRRQILTTKVDPSTVRGK